jgi:hypothetical protein
MPEKAGDRNCLFTRYWLENGSCCDRMIPVSTTRIARIVFIFKNISVKFIFSSPQNAE